MGPISLDTFVPSPASGAWIATRCWRKVGDAAERKLQIFAKPLKSLALPRGLEPLFSP